MKNKMHYVISSVIIVAIAFYVAWQNDITASENVNDVMRIISDGLFAAGIIFIGVGALEWASTKGIYDMFGFGVGRVFRDFIPTIEKEKYEKFYEYKQLKDEKGREWHPHILLSGVWAIGMSAVFLGLYYIV